MSGQEERQEEEVTNTETRGTCTEEASVLSLVLDIQRRPVAELRGGQTSSIDIRTHLRGNRVSVSQQTADERCNTPSVCGSLAVNISEAALTRSITLENIDSRAEARIEVVEVGERPPPSYTSMETACQTVFQHPVPPPSYEQTVGIRYLDRELPFITGNDTASIWGYRSQPAYCSRCNAVVLTSVETEFCFVTHLAAALSCLFLCWPCIFCPYFMSVFQEVHHQCPACNTFLGRYRPIPFRNESLHVAR